MANTAISSLRDEVIFRVTPDNSTDTTSSTRIVSRINWAIRDVAEIKQPDELEAEDQTSQLSDMVASYPHPADLLITKTLTILGSASVRPISLRPLTRKRYDVMDVTNTGESTMFFDYDGFYYLVPTPNASLQDRRLRVAYVKIPAVVTDADGELSPLDTRWDEIIVLGAMQKYLRDNNEFERANAAMRDYQMALGIHRSKKAINFAMAGGRSIGLGRAGRSGGGMGGRW